jgi:hypothetical protein
MKAFAEVVIGSIGWLQANPIECLMIGMVLVIVPIAVVIAKEIKYS